MINNETEYPNSWEDLFGELNKVEKLINKEHRIVDFSEEAFQHYGYNLEGFESMESMPGFEI